MKLSDFLTDVGRPIAYYPGLRRITGSTTATIFLCQFVYWTGKEGSGDGWIYKTSDEIESETGLSYHEQKTAREKLKSNNLIKEKYARLDHQMYFKVDLDTLNNLWGNPQSDIPESHNVALGNDALRHSLISNTETTTENTSHENETFESEPLSIEESFSTSNKTKATMRSEKKGDMVDGLLHYAGQAEKTNEIEDCLEALSKGLNRNIPRQPIWQDLAKWIIKQGNMKGWIRWYMADGFRVENAWRLTPEQIRSSWPSAIPPEPVKKEQPKEPPMKFMSVEDTIKMLEEAKRRTK